MLAFITACSGQSNAKVLESNHAGLKVSPKTDAQIDEYVVEILEDTKGNLWFGTLAKGVARYDGKSLTYFSTKDGLCGNAVVSMAEDKAGNMWFGTHAGLSKYDGRTFTNFTSKEGLCHDRVSHIMFDRAGTLWVGTWGGVSRYNGATFATFPLPIPAVEVPGYQATANWVTTIMEDQQGNIWFGRSGYGACKYDGDSFTQFTKKDGLASNCVQALLEDQMGQYGEKMGKLHQEMIDWFFYELKKDALIPSLNGKARIIFDEKGLSVSRTQGTLPAVSSRPTRPCVLSPSCFWSACWL